MPKTKIGEETRRRLGMLNKKEEVAQPTEEQELANGFVDASLLADIGMYLGIEKQNDGYAVVLIRKEKGGVSSKATLYAGRKQKALAMEGFRLASGKFVIDFNQSQLGE